MGFKTILCHYSLTDHKGYQISIYVSWLKKYMLFLQMILCVHEVCFVQSNLFLLTIF